MRRLLLFIGLFVRYAGQVALGLAVIGLSAASQLASAERSPTGLDSSARARAPLRSLAPKGPSIP